MKSAVADFIKRPFGAYYSKALEIFDGCEAKNVIKGRYTVEKQHFKKRDCHACPPSGGE
jgi:hypothetical protein